MSDDWHPALDFGDCEDYALVKQIALIERGWPKGSLRLATAYSPKTGLHAVLIVSTIQGDFVLDNVENKIRHWSTTRYRFLKIQSAFNPMIWRGVRDFWHEHV